MKTIYDLKPKFQNLLRPITNHFAKVGITANQITIFALFLSIITGLLLSLNPNNNFIFCIVPIILFIRMALNAIDGMLAREHNMKSDLGFILNEIGDVISDTAIYLPFGLISGVNLLLVSIFVCLAIISEMTGVLAMFTGNVRRYDGPLGKSDRAFILSLIGIIYSAGISIVYWINILFFILVFLLIITIINRIKNGLKRNKI